MAEIMKTKLYNRVFKNGRNAVFIRMLLALSLLTTGGMVAADNLDAATVSSSLDHALGMKTGYLGASGAARFAAAEQWLGKPLRWTVAIADSRSPVMMRQSVWGQLVAPDAFLPGIESRTDLVMTVPLTFIKETAHTPEGQAAIRTALLETAAGQWDADYTVVAKNLAKGGYSDAVIRLGHEATCVCQPWSSVGNADAYIAAFRHVHDVMIAAEPKLRFEWNTTKLNFGSRGPKAYPGDSYVDIIGMDIYYEPWKGDKAPYSPTVWARSYARPLTAHLEFAKSHGKPVSYAEWAVGGVDEPRFISDMHSWLMSLPASGPGSLLYASYFNVPNQTYNLTSFPASAVMYKTLFGS